MEIIQVLIGSMFSLIAMATVLYIGFRAHTISADLTEIKELLKQQHTPRVAADPLAALALAKLDTATSLQGSKAPGEWPSVMDPEYNADEKGAKP